MANNAIDNTNLLQMCRDCGAVGFVPSVTYVYDAGAGTVVATNGSTIPAGDTLKLVKLRVTDCFGGERRGFILVGSGGAGYTSAPTVVFATGTGATGTAVINAAGKVTSVTITAGGSGYTTGNAVSFTGGGGFGAKGTVVASAGAVTSVTLTADDTADTIDVSGLDRSKPLALSVQIVTTNGIYADGGAYGLQAAGNVSHWDIQRNAIGY